MWLLAGQEPHQSILGMAWLAQMTVRLLPVPVVCIFRDRTVVAAPGCFLRRARLRPPLHAAACPHPQLLCQVLIPHGIPSLPAFDQPKQSAVFPCRSSLSDSAECSMNQNVKPDSSALPREALQQGRHPHLFLHCSKIHDSITPRSARFGARCRFRRGAFVQGSCRRVSNHLSIAGRSYVIPAGEALCLQLQLLLCVTPACWGSFNAMIAKANTR